MANAVKQTTKTVYIVLSATPTIPARIIRLLSGHVYSHVSITSDRSLGELYSFCRRYKYFPFPGGFVEENKVGVFNLFSKIPCEIYKFEMTDEESERFYKLMSDFKNNQRRYSYSFIGLLAMMFGIPLKRKRHFVCSQFVAYVLEESGITLFEKDVALIRPEDFVGMDGAKLVFKGNLKEYLRNA